MNNQSNNKNKIIKFCEWIIYILGYSLILLILSNIFKKTIVFNKELFYIWIFITTIIIYLLNKTVKPLLVWLTIPLTGLTLGLFYPFINVIILQIVDIIMGNNFSITGTFIPFIIAIFISIMNAVIDNMIIDPLIRR